MAQKPNPNVSRFRDRVDWVVNNLDPEPSYRRFVTEINDIFVALEEALEVKAFAVGTYERIPGRRTWERSLSSDSVPKIYLDWLYTLYPDLVSIHFEAKTFEEFSKIGSEIESIRGRWRPAIRYFAENRASLEKIAKEFYRNDDQSDEHRIGDLPFPLLTQPGWIRSEPLQLHEDTEKSNLHSPGPSPRFKLRILAGLRGDYVTYKGALAYATRRMVKIEPQQNGEIFCVHSVVFDDGGFFGFQYVIARYFDYINTCEILGAELADWVILNKKPGKISKLPFRGSSKDAFNLKNRAAYPGINCLTVFLNYSEARIKRGNYFLLHKRDETQLQAQNSINVIPAGGHQSYAKGGWPEDTAIWRTMVREFAEELFDQEHLNNQPETWEDFLEYKDVKRIKKVFFDEPNQASSVFLHGFGLDPVTLKPEVLITIVIDWDKVPKGKDGFKLKFNWELQTKRKISSTRHQWARLSKTELIRQACGRVQSIGDVTLETLPAGAAAMILTARHYDFLGLPSDGKRPA